VIFIFTITALIAAKSILYAHSEAIEVFFAATVKQKHELEGFA